MHINSQWRIFSITFGFRPLALYKGGLICFSRNKIYLCSLDFGEVQLLAKLPTSRIIYWVGGYLRILSRIFRVEPTHAIIFDEWLYIARKSEIWLLNCATGEIKLDFTIPNGRRSLAINLVDSPKYGKCLVFGEYFNNPNMDGVNIWVKNLSLNEWFNPCRFNSNSINHVHNVYQISKGFLVLCGDFDNGSSMWQLGENFEKLEVALKGKQIYRSCWLIKFENDFLYATDTQIDSNYLCKLISKEGELIIEPILRTESSSIYYGEATPNELYFSTTVEGREPSGHFLFDVFDLRLGIGIGSKFAKINQINPANLEINEVISAKKDFWPCRLGQFGTFTFPSGLMPSDYLIAYSVGLNGIDGACLILKKT